MNIIIVGFGSAGKFYYDLLKKNERYNIFILESHKIKNIKARIFRDLKDLNKENIDFEYAIISTPSHLHYKYSEFFLKKKVNVLIEKPMVLKLIHAKKLIFLSKKNKVKCWVAFQNRHNKAISKLKSDIHNNKIGKISLIDCVLLWKRDYHYYNTSWRGKYRSDGGVLANQAIHLLDALIYIFGKIKNFNVIASFNKKKLQAEDLIIINFLHENKSLSSFKATTRAYQDYQSALDVIGDKGRIIVKGISLNTFNYFKGGKIFENTKYSENFMLGLGPKSGMGNGHSKLLKEFLNDKIKKSSKDLEIEKNYYLLKVIHSIYSAIFKKNLNKIKNSQSIWGK